MHPWSDADCIQRATKYKNKIRVFIRHCSVSSWKNVCPSAPALENMNTALPNYLEKCSLIIRQVPKKRVYEACRAWMNDRLGFMTSFNRERETTWLFWEQEFTEKFGQTCIVKFACSKLRRIFSKWKELGAKVSLYISYSFGHPCSGSCGRVTRCPLGPISIPHCPLASISDVLGPVLLTPAQVSELFFSVF